ncbi:NAD-dependent epimerase/dehydratase family protein [Microscilla marina]|uniref:Putative dihydroflavonol-4-reductase n=1 Tax=Microscilla marina ATCC 23134 TaxID=313606 RepID=A1ZKR0_MICM2|nr:NAD-dependent epimerase/dehydratase family protein [Microscilla marina]EAY28876.1 putative dihydroflavonol-4-reductase [Microscilla marina ATCC 23134]
MIFITGCSGLVGSFIARRLLAAGHSVRALRRKDSNLHYLTDIKDQIEWVEGDVLDVSRLYDVMQGAKQVIHSAALVSFTPKTKDLMYKVNIEGTANVVNISLELGVDKLVFISSVAALGRRKNTEVIDEKAQWEPSKFNTHYAQTKYLAEMEVWRGHVEGLNSIVVNPSLILGPSPWERSSTQLFKYVWDEKKFYAAGSLNYVDVRDVAEIVYQLFVGEHTGERYIVNAGNISFKELFEKIAKTFNKRAPYIKVTPLIAAFAWRGALLQSFFTRKPPFISKETAYMSQKHFYYKNNKIIDTLNFKFKPLQESIDWACTELAQYNHLSV